MEFSLDPAQAALQARAREFARTVVLPRAAEIDRQEQYPWDIVKALAAAGFLGMTIPTAYGGQGRSFLDAVLVIEEMAKACTVTARIVVETNMGAISTIMHYGSEEQRGLAAGLVLAGDKPAICITEPDAGSDTTAMSTRADKRGNAYVLNGRKHWITGAGISRLHLIFARVFDERGVELGIGGFLAVAGEAKGLRVVRREATMGLRGMPEGEIVFEDLGVPAAMVLAPQSGFKRGFADLMNAYNSQRVGAGTVAMGIAAGALDLAVQWSKSREQFGRPIAEFQGMQWLLADMQTQLTASRLSCMPPHVRAEERAARSPIPCWPRKRRSSLPRRPFASSTRRCRCSERAAIHATCRSSAWRGTCACSPSAAGLHRSCARWSPPGCSAGSCRRPATGTPRQGSGAPRRQSDQSRIAKATFCDPHHSRLRPGGIGSFHGNRAIALRPSKMRGGTCTSSRLSRRRWR